MVAMMKIQILIQRTMYIGCGYFRHDDVKMTPDVRRSATPGGGDFHLVFHNKYPYYPVPIEVRQLRDSKGTPRSLFWDEIFARVRFRYT